ncbi:hypothetical protein WA026_006764, partial [Henosepilachna vigintioctopunctata]
MAPTEVDGESESDEFVRSNVRSVEVQFFYNCCIKEQCKMFIYQVCEGSYHDSCLIRKKLKVTVKTTVLCAECAELTETKPGIKEFYNENSIMEIQYLRHLVAEMDDKNILKPNNQ